jgi:hypothetical protein
MPDYRYVTDEQRIRREMFSFQKLVREIEELEERRETIRAQPDRTVFGGDVQRIPTDLPEREFGSLTGLAAQSPAPFERPLSSCHPPLGQWAN